MGQAGAEQREHGPPLLDTKAGKHSPDDAESREWPFLELRQGCLGVGVGGCDRARGIDLLQSAPYHTHTHTRVHSHTQGNCSLAVIMNNHSEGEGLRSAVIL